MKEKQSDIPLKKIHLLQKHGAYKLVIFNMIIVSAHSGKIKSREVF